VVQSEAGIIDIKRRHLAYQLYLGHKNGLKLPKKRVAPSRSIGHVVQQEIRLRNMLQQISRENWNPHNPDAAGLHAKMQQLSHVFRIMEFPIKTARYVQRKIRRTFHGA
jgi:hypothetical protein